MAEHAGYHTDSPAPSANRARSNVPNACTAPVAAVAADQRIKPPAITHFTSRRSTSQPESGRKNEYVQKKDDSRTPSCVAESWNSFLSSGAAIERLPRSK